MYREHRRPIHKDVIYVDLTNSPDFATKTEQRGFNNRNSTTQARSSGGSTIVTWSKETPKSSPRSNILNEYTIPIGTSIQPAGANPGNASQGAGKEYQDRLEGKTEEGQFQFEYRRDTNNFALTPQNETIDLKCHEEQDHGER